MSITKTAKQLKAENQIKINLARHQRAKVFQFCDQSSASRLGLLPLDNKDFEWEKIKKGLIKVLDVCYVDKGRKV